MNATFNTINSVFSSYEDLVEKGGHQLSADQEKRFKESLENKLDGGVSKEEMAQVLHDTNRIYQEDVNAGGDPADGYNTSDTEFNSFLGTKGYEKVPETLFGKDKEDADGNVWINKNVRPLGIRGGPKKYSNI
jgi:hypothetical protein